MKKTLSVVLALALVLSLCVTAFAEEKTAIDHTAYSQYPLLGEGESMTITVSALRDATYGMDVEQSWFWNWAEYATGIDFEVNQIISTNQGELVSLMFASDEVPDLLWGLGIGTSAQTKYGLQEGQLKDLSSYITEERMPHLTKWFEAYPDSKAAITLPNGAIYSLPGYHNIKRAIGSQEMHQFNTTWLKECGLDFPRTLDELKTTLYAFKEYCPDGVPMAGAYGAVDSLSYVLNAFGYLYGGGNMFTGVAIKDGKAVIPAGDADFKEFLKLANQFYNDGIINKDYFSADLLTAQNYVSEHKTGLVAGAVYQILPDKSEWQQWESVYPLTSAWNPEPQWKDVSSYKTGSFCVGANVSDEKLDKLLRFADFFYSELGMAYLWDGPHADSADLIGMIEGWYYDYEANSRIFIQEEKGEYEFGGLAYVQGPVGANNLGFGNRSHSLTYPDTLTYFYEVTQFLDGRPLDQINSFAYSPEYGDGWQRLKLEDHCAPYFKDGFPTFVYYDEETQDTIDDIRVQLNGFVESEVAKFITGARSIEDFDSFVSECEAYGLRELETIYQEAYASYLAAK